MSEPASVDSPAKFQSRAQSIRAEALREYVRVAKEDIEVADVNWEDNYWKGAGAFVRLASVKLGAPKRKAEPSTLLDANFINFAKAYIRERHLQNPAESRNAHVMRFSALRLVECALVELHGSANPLKIDRDVLDRAAALATSHFKGPFRYHVGRAFHLLVGCLTNRGILPLDLGNWTSPIPAHRNIGNTVGGAGDRARQAKLPNPEALDVLAEIFNRDLDPEDERCQRDIYTTCVAALLLCAPSRGQEVHRLPVNLLFEATDRFGGQQTGLRLHASKGFGAYVKWVWSGMVPVAQKAIERLKAITAEARALARHLEDSTTRKTFFRHAMCPAVDDDKPLTTEQVCAALGVNRNSLAKAGLSSATNVHSLNSLWNEWVLPRHARRHPYFPYVTKKDQTLGDKGGLKFSEALFCMRAEQLGSFTTSKVILWMPSLSSAFSMDVAMSRKGRSVNIFDRYGYTGSDGEPLKLTSHQLRHLLNTEAQRVELPDSMIAHWSGRLNVKQNETYDNRPEQERVDQARPVVEKMDALLALQDSVAEAGQTIQAGPWRIDIGKEPRSCADLDEMQPRLAGLKTEYGECHHDWAMAPCEGFVACLECREHACIKGSDQTSQERLERIERLHRQVLAELTKAQAAVAQEDWGAQEWVELQQRYAAKLKQLIGLLRNPGVPEHSVIRMANAQHPTHLHRVLRGIAVRAIEDKSAAADVMKQMLEAVSNTESGVQPIRLHAPKRFTKPETEGRAHGT